MLNLVWIKLIKFSKIYLKLEKLIKKTTFPKIFVIFDYRTHKYEAQNSQHIKYKNQIL